MSCQERGGIFFRFVALIVFCALFALLFLIRHPLFRLAGNFWVVDDPLVHADAILVLSDDNYSGDRATRAAELYRAAWAPTVVASGRVLRPYAGIAELIQKDLENRGVPASAIIPVSHHAGNTREESMVLRGVVVGKGWHRILLVTSNYHTRRARYIFRKVFPSSIEVVTVPARDIDFDPDAWWESREGTKIFFLETVGYCVALWELRNQHRDGAPGAARSLVLGSNQRSLAGTVPF